MTALLTPVPLHRAVRAAALVATLVVMASSAGAQTAEQLFDGTQADGVHLPC